MPFDTQPIISDLLTVGILFLVFLLFYSKFKKQTMGDTFNQIKDMFKREEEGG